MTAATGTRGVARAARRGNMAMGLVVRRRRAMKRVFGSQRKAAERLGCSQPMVSYLIAGTERSFELEQDFARLVGETYERLFVAPEGVIMTTPSGETTDVPDVAYGGD